MKKYKIDNPANYVEIPAIRDTYYVAEFDDTDLEIELGATYEEAKKNVLSLGLKALHIICIKKVSYKAIDEGGGLEAYLRALKKHIKLILYHKLGTMDLVNRITNQIDTKIWLKDLN